MNSFQVGTLMHSKAKIPTEDITVPFLKTTVQRTTFLGSKYIHIYFKDNFRLKWLKISEQYAPYKIIWFLK